MNAPIVKKIRVIGSDLGVESVIFHEGPLIIKGPSSFVEMIEEWIKAYLAHKPLPPLLFNMPPTFSDFTRRVLEKTYEIPFGTTLSYGELAALAGHPGAARAVGSVMNRNPFPLFIPCHRVIHAGGGLGGYAYGLYVKKELLNLEGLEI